MDHIKWWIDCLTRNVEQKLGEEATQVIFEQCGRSCSDLYLAKAAKEIKNQLGESASIDDTIAYLNSHPNVGKLTREGDTIVSEYPGGDCTCPVCKDGYVKHPSFKYCCTGNLKQRLEIIFQQPVDVIMTDAEFEGASAYKFKIRLL